MTTIRNEENKREQISDADNVEGPIEGVMREEITEALKYLKIGKAPWPSEVYAVMIVASGDVGINVDGTLQKNTKWKRNTSRQSYKCCYSYFNGKGVTLNYDMYWE